MTVIKPGEIRVRRKARGLTQAALAALVGVDQAAISLLERGLRRPRPRTLIRLLRMLDDGRDRRAADRVGDA